MAAITIPVAATSARGRRRLRARECGSKVRYLSETTASNAALLHAWAGRPGMDAYRCSFCDDWHVGHTPGSRRRRRCRRGSG